MIPSSTGAPVKGPGRPSDGLSRPRLTRDGDEERSVPRVEGGSERVERPGRTPPERKLRAPGLTRTLHIGTS